MEFYSLNKVAKMELPGVVSHQLIGKNNVPEGNYNFTDVTVQPGAVQPRHSHEFSEQTWYCVSGTGVLLLKDDTERVFLPGDIARFEKGDIHGMVNRSEEPIRYITITCPRTDFSGNYDKIIEAEK